MNPDFLFLRLLSSVRKRHNELYDKNPRPYLLRWRLRTEAATALAGHVGFFLLLTAGMPGQILWTWLVLLP